jgi:hypothetical protein
MHFLENLSNDAALITKRLSEGKVGNVGAAKLYANRTNEGYLKRLIDRQTKLRHEKGKPIVPPATTTAQGELLLKASQITNIPKK